MTPALSAAETNHHEKVRRCRRMKSRRYSPNICPTSELCPRVQTRLMIHLGETLPARLEGEQREIRWGTLLLLIGVLFPCSLISFGIGAPTGPLLPSQAWASSMDGGIPKHLLCGSQNDAQSGARPNLPMALTNGPSRGPTNRRMVVHVERR